MGRTKTSPLQPINPQDLSEAEREKKTNWFIRRLRGSIMGRVVGSTVETFKAFDVLCLSPWGDSSPLILPSIRFRDIVLESVVAATGGTAALAAPMTGPLTDSIVGGLADSLIAHTVVEHGFNLAADEVNEEISDRVADKRKKAGNRNLRITTTAGVKTIQITLKYHHTLTDAQLGFFRASDAVHCKGTDLLASTQEYLATRNGWFSPALYATGRRPVIPRSVDADVIYSHGPFIKADYALALRLVEESATVVDLCDKKAGKNDDDRRIAVLLVGIKPYRMGMWSSSQRPDEDIMKWSLVNGVPTVLLPARKGCPIQSWFTLTLHDLHKLQLPPESGTEAEGKDHDHHKSGHRLSDAMKALHVPDKVAHAIGDGSGGKFDFAGVTTALWEFLDLCVDTDHVDGSGDEDVLGGDKHVKGGDALRPAAELVVKGAVRTRESKDAMKEVDLERAGIVLLRLPYHVQAP